MQIINDIDARNSLFLIIDLQSKLAPSICNFSNILNCTLKLSQASCVHDIPVLITEQYKEGLGKTLLQIKSEVPQANYFDKTYFSACGEPSFLELVKQYKRHQIVVVGTEAHVCVLLTCLDLLRNGFEVTVIADGIGSRNQLHVQIAIEQLRQAGATISCAETVIFQWTERAATADFKKILPIIKV
ncbi:isochorismatase family protein [Pseudoalteromonas distincta]|uniref:isochorismatase family protein n=1 Tax=Pseudoalteromonas distincta TaxID=77608 RepID=UPI0032E1BFEF